MAAVDAEEHETSPAPASASSAPATRKRKRQGATATDGAPAAADDAGGMHDDVLRNIFSRLPTRAAVACTALSKHHRRLVTGEEFRRLHLLLGASAAPLPRPHVAYLATAPITRRGDERVVGKFHGFHVAGAGMGIGHAPMRALTCCGEYKSESYINTCNGIILLAKKKKAPSGSFILWNPAIADDEKKLTILEGLPMKWKYCVAGLGYGHRSKTYKLLLCRVCVVTNDGPHTFSVWLLAAEDHRWQRRCAIGESNIYHRSITAVWDHGDALFLLVDSTPYLYDITNERMMETKTSIDVKPEEAAYTLCWGYKPTLVSPGSIVGELAVDDDEEDGRRRRRDRTADILAAVKPVRERDVRRGRKATLDVTCFMEMLVRIMRKLPGGMQDVIDMPLLNASLDVRYRFSDED